ncbi:hypothetical protein O181_054681 [Austropuccinia psidii MF-1]|uniref:DUF4939 domain-containing protein n=1 Tax=Austropuccinia psidii MF-1 TaxID=1389203 RepID=A0A9Q3E2Z6_9BASI|nr:hypothetical protein [Austropuccinia psidii MF-1]
MPVQHSLLSNDTRSQINQAVFTPTARAPLEHTPSVHQRSSNLDRGPPMEGAEPTRSEGVKSRRSRPFSGLLGGYPSISQGPRSRLGNLKMKRGRSLSLSNQPLASQAEANFLMMEQMNKFIAELTQSVSPRDNSKSPAFKTPSMKEPDSFDGTKAYKLRGFIQTCQLVFHNDPESFFSDRKKVLYSTSFFTGRAEKFIEPYLPNISNEDPSYLLNNWKLFETQLFTLFGDPNEVRKAEQELKSLRMKESGKFDRLQELMEITLELDTRYHDRHNEKGSHEEKKPPISESNSSKPPQSPSSKNPYHRKKKKGKNFQVSNKVSFFSLHN